MSKIAFLFPGQGSQYVGMAKDFFEQDSSYKEKFLHVDEILGNKLTDIILNGPEEKLTLTSNTQPALFAVSALMYDRIYKEGVSPDVVAGHSLGEYTALYAAGVLSFEDALSAVSKRGQIMADAVPSGKGTMAAIIGLKRDLIQAVLDKVEGIVNIANINSPEQVVISGEKEAVLKAMDKLKIEGAKRAIELSVSGPFHSKLMVEAGQKLGLELDEIKLNDPIIDVMANYSADYVRTGDKAKELLVNQVAGPVRWVEIIERMAKDGVDIFVEVGPGKVLSGLNRRISRELKTYNIEDMASFEKTLAILKESVLA
jgi:[acyl-carrier-protein] S-malonyltransferase